ncbi:TPA: hypothetical protein KQG27_002551 [Clostridioides difficile]|nr:hypothetical protein [Clostridioides difficile]HBG5373143.1 hypothetical protein [Clostridioides difficile]
MAFYVIERTIKKRRGCYSESDIHISPCHLESRNYYARYNFSDVKNINIPETTKHVINSFEAYYLAGGEYNEKIIIKDCTIRQDTTIELIPDPIIFISNDLGYISYAQSINYKITDSDPTTRFKIVYKLNDVVIGEKYNTTDSNYTIDLTEEHLSKLSFNSRNNITIELSTNDGGVFLTKIVSFTKGNTKPKLNINSYDSTSAKFTVIDTDNNLTKIEWYLDDVLKETITTDLTVEKTINYELTDNAIHTLKIVATDAENATAEKVLSISKEIMPLQEDANLSDISTKLIEIGEGFRNGKTSIINTLALKNIEASLNNTLVELSEKIKTSFDSSDASVQDLMNQLTQANNTISQLNSKYKVASGNSVVNYCTNTKGFYFNSDHLFLFSGAVQINGLNFVPNIFFTTFELIDSGYFRKFFVFACRGIFTQDFVITAHYHRLETYLKDFKVEGEVLKLNERDVYMDNRGIQLPCQRQGSSFKWQAIKFI